MIGLVSMRDAGGLPSELRGTVEQLTKVGVSTMRRNIMLSRYYAGEITVQDRGRRVSAKKLQNDQVCYWPEAVVDKLAERIRLESFVTSDGPDETLDAIMDSSNVVNEYASFLTSKLVHGPMFCAVNNTERGVRVRMHSALDAVALPDPERRPGVVGAGMCVARVERTPWSGGPVPTQVNLYTPGMVTVIRRLDQSHWSACPMPVPERDPMFFAFVHKRSGERPFGKSRITRAIRCYTEDAVRVLWNHEVTAAVYSQPMRALLGLSDAQYDALMKKGKDATYNDLMLLAGTNDEGNAPTLLQLSASSPEPYIASLRMLASLVSGASGVPLASLGITTDNPSSADAIQAAREDICLVAEDDIAADKWTLRRVAMCAMAVNEGISTEELTDRQRSVSAHFANPTIPSLNARASFVQMVGSMDDGFAKTTVGREMLGFDKATIARLESDETRAAAAAALRHVFEGGDGGEGATRERR